MRVLVKSVHRFEDILLVVLLSSMILLASTQIILRNLFEFGLVWADPLLRIMVLWLGMIGATVASRDNRHIHIDLISHFFNKTSYLLIQTFVGQFTSWVCLLVAWNGAYWVRLDFADGLTGILGIPAWAFEIIIPITFALIGIRYFLFSLRWGSLYLRRVKPRASRSK
jgi:TRAP-type C4-dicarboxylate transport system permease small subunit